MSKGKRTCESRCRLPTRMKRKFILSLRFYIFDFFLRLFSLFFTFFTFFFIFQWIVECWQFLEDSRGDDDVVFIFVLFIFLVLLPGIVCLYRICTWNLDKVVLKILLIADTDCSASHSHIAARIHSHGGANTTYSYSAEYPVKLMRRCEIEAKKKEKNE